MKSPSNLMKSIIRRLRRMSHEALFKIQSLPLRKGGMNRVWFYSNGCRTELCEIGGRHNTDKSPLNDGKGKSLRYAHAYTPIYDLLFASLRYKEINIAEVGILRGASMKTLREYFSKAHLYGFEYYEEYLELNKSYDLAKTEINFMDITSEKSIIDTFERLNIQFDIIIEDSTHIVTDQVRFIKCCTKYLKPGGILIIEDIFDDARADEKLFEDVFHSVSDKYCYTSFIYPQDSRTRVGDWNNEKILVMIRNENV